MSYEEIYKKLTDDEITDFSKYVGILNHGKRVTKKQLEKMSKNTQECVRLFDKEVASVWRASG